VIEVGEEEDTQILSAPKKEKLGARKKICTSKATTSKKKQLQ
jgi:hypothetical protein